MDDARNEDEVREHVRTYYADIARRGGRVPGMGASASCDCAPDGAGAGPCDCDRSAAYPVALLAEMPERVTDLSLGCGDAVSSAGLQPGETVLDLGSGGGIDCFLAARAVGEGGRVIGVDMTPEMVALARSNASELGLANVTFELGRIEALPVADAVADVVISNCVINLAPDKAPVFAEMFRVLRPGGRVHVSDMVTEGPMAETVRRDPDSWSACVAGALPMADFAAGLEAAGFTDVRVVPAPGVSPEQRRAGYPFSALIAGRKPA